jgi:ABC-type transport system involved in multi-copper enzyme maturation permease subunit
MIIRQTNALFLDAYRELNAKKLFWITMILSLLVVVAFALTGVSEKGIHALWFTIPGTEDFGAAIDPALWYKFLFISFGIPIWLTWAATILALVSTAGIFPDLLASGSIDLVLSKPISRLRLFLTKYVTGLLFAALQVLVFAGASFLVVGIRGGDWEPGLFLAVPIVVLFFSYLFSICVLIGMITRSTIAALLITVLMWFLLFVVNATEAGFLSAKIEQEYWVDYHDARIAFSEPRAQALRAQIEAAEADPEVEVSPRDPRRLERAESMLEESREQLAERQESLEGVTKWHDRIMLAKSFVPKTGETIGLLDRRLLDIDALNAALGTSATDEIDDDLDEEEETAEEARRTRGAGAIPTREARMQDAYRSRSMVWIIGTSLVFEGILMLISIVLFARRDF